MSLKIENLQFAYSKTPILKDICFRADKGQLVALLGENGSGKTTLLKNINRILKPSNGSVWIDNTDVARMSRREIARTIAYMPQAQESVHFTVFETMLLGREARKAGPPDDEDLQKVEDILKLVRLDHLAMRSTHELSGGELQKVVLGRALAQEPRVLLLDEPISHLDPVNQIEVMSLLHEVTRGMGMISLVVTHDLNSALRFADRFIMLKNGGIVAQGGRETLTPEVIKQVYGIDSFIVHVADVPVLVPLVSGVRPHQHFHSHQHKHRDSEGREFTHNHSHTHEHAHAVDGHIYDHPHKGRHGVHEHWHLEEKRCTDADGC